MVTSTVFFSYLTVFIADVESVSLREKGLQKLSPLGTAKHGRTLFGLVV